MRLVRQPVAPQWSWDVELGPSRRDAWEGFLPKRNGHAHGHGNGQNGDGPHGHGPNGHHGPNGNGSGHR